MSNAYDDLRNRQQAEFNKLPIGAAFSNKQFNEMMEAWGLTENDTDKILHIGGGCYIRKTDRDLVRTTATRHHEELEAAIGSDETGEGFIYEMFLSELYNHEAGYTGDYEETLDALGYTLEEVSADERLARGLMKAWETIIEEERRKHEEE